MSTDAPPLLESDIPELPLVARGKVRDIYKVPADAASGTPERLLIVTTDRISAFDVILPQGIPDKGRVLTAVSEFWFDQLADVCPHHLITTDVQQMPECVSRQADTLAGRTMLVKSCDPMPVECVARGFLAGSGLKEYRADGTVCGIPLPQGLTNSSRLPETIFTPATKAVEGHDENISFERMAEIVGTDLGARLRELTLDLYGRGARHAESVGIILADTKFEFGMHNGELTLIDEVLTPDSSRYWELETYSPGSSQPSFDKQPVRDWLEESGWDKQPPPPNLPPEVVSATTARYRAIYERLTGAPLS